MLKECYKTWIQRIIFKLTNIFLYKYIKYNTTDIETQSSLSNSNIFYYSYKCPPKNISLKILKKFKSFKKKIRLRA